MKKKIDIEIRPNPKYEFSYGSCATIAIAAAFDMDIRSLNVILDLIGIKGYKEGLTYNQCVKVINKLALSLKKEITYIPNLDITFGQYIYFNREESHLIMFSEHLSYMKDGIVYDNYFTGYFNDQERLEFLSRKPTGFWRIRDKVIKNEERNTTSTFTWSTF